MTSNLRDFLEQSPLYTKVRGIVPRLINDFRSAILQINCRQCNEIRTFRYHENALKIGMPTLDQGRIVSDFNSNATIVIRYRCTGCNAFHDFLLYIGPDYEFIEKVGQFPNLDIKISKVLERGLGERAELFKQGFISERHGFGIGAFAYYRRIIEEFMHVLLDQIEDLCPEPEKGKYHVALERSRTEHTAETRLQLVKDFVPAHLRPDGINPIDVLYTSLSSGIHSRTDEECLEYATRIRLALSRIIEEIQRHKDTKKTFGDEMRKLLAKKIPKGK